LSIFESINNLQTFNNGEIMQFHRSLRSKEHQHKREGLHHREFNFVRYQRRIAKENGQLHAVNKIAEESEPSRSNFAGKPIQWWRILRPDSINAV
jgi:competence transcription factor ComK